MLLAGADALEPAIRSLGFELDDCLRLDALPAMLRDEEEFPSLSPAVRQRALAACKRVRPWTGRVTGVDIQKRLLGVRDIDPGEASCLALMVQDSTLYFLSGDKRWMRALSSQKTLQPIREAVAGRVLCLENVVDRMIGALGIRATATLLSPARPYNQTLKVLFSDGERTEEENCREGIRAYLSELERVLGSGFFFNAS